MVEESEMNTNFFLNLDIKLSALEIVKDHTLMAEKQLNCYETLYSELINQNNPSYTENLKYFLAK